MCGACDARCAMCIRILQDSIRTDSWISERSARPVPIGRRFVWSCLAWLGWDFPLFFFFLSVYILCGTHYTLLAFLRTNRGFPNTSIYHGCFVCLRACEGESAESLGLCGSAGAERQAEQITYATRTRTREWSVPFRPVFFLFLFLFFQWHILPSRS